MVLPGQYVGQTLRLDQPDSVGGEIIAISDISLGTQEKTVPPRTARRQTSFFADCRMGLRQKARRRLESVAGMTTEVPHIISSSIIALDSFSSLSTDWANAFPEQRKRVAIKRILPCSFDGILSAIAARFPLQCFPSFTENQWQQGQRSHRVCPPDSPNRVHDQSGQRNPGEITANSGFSGIGS